jgi:hypothetical protein
MPGHPRAVSPTGSSQCCRRSTHTTVRWWWHTPATTPKGYAGAAVRAAPFRVPVSLRCPQADELSFSRGDAIQVLQMNDDGRWVGELDGHVRGAQTDRDTHPHTHR